MSSKDKTREKLMGTMRKTKAEAGIEHDDKSEQITRQATTVAPATQGVKKEPAADKRPESNTIDPNKYQSGRRIWPD